jgi:hypothetical protein
MEDGNAEDWYNFIKDWLLTEYPVFVENSDYHPGRVLHWGFSYSIIKVEEIMF